MSDETKKEEKKKSPMDAKGMLKKHGKAGTKIHQNDRKSIITIKDTKYHKKGKILNPHPVMADQMIKDGLAEEYTPPKKKK